MKRALWLAFLLAPLALSAGENRGRRIPAPEQLVPLQTRPLKKGIQHPPIKLLDENGRPVIRTGKPVSTRKTCGQCHDYDFITHSFHFQQGYDHWDNDWGTKHHEPGSYSDGMFGRQYDYPYYHMTPTDWKRRGVDFEYGTPNWALQCAICHTGSGPLEYDRQGRRLDQIPESEIQEGDPDFYWWHRKADKILRWDWKQSGVREANCFLCHTPNYSKGIQDMRTVGVGMFHRPHFASANAAGLISTGIVKKVTDDGRVVYNPRAFEPDGTVKPGWLTISGEFARLDACLQCHAAPVVDGKVKIWYNYPVVRTINRGILRKAFVWSGENISDSREHIANKDQLNYPWDVHARAGLTCLDCHDMPNRPGGVRSTPQGPEVQPVTFSQFIKQPDHNFGIGHPITWKVAPEHMYTAKRCEDCHNALEKGHDWLPEKELHLRKVSCEVCHVPQAHYWALNFFNFALPKPEPFSLHREAKGACGEAPQRYTFVGAQGDPIEDSTALITGFYPLYIPRNLKPGEEPRIMPYSVTFSLHWIDARGERVRFRRILRAFFNRVDGNWDPKPEVLQVFDANHNGWIEDDEALFDTPEKVALAKKLLAAQGVQDPKLELVAMPFSLSHGVVPKEHAVRSCDECHAPNSRIFNQGKYERVIVDRPLLFEVSRIYSEDYLGIPIARVENGKTVWDNSRLLAGYHLVGALEPETHTYRHLYWLDLLGKVLVLLTIVGILFHALGRLLGGKKS